MPKGLWEESGDKLLPLPSAKGQEGGLGIALPKKLLGEAPKLFYPWHLTHAQDRIHVLDVVRVLWSRRQVSEQVAWRW